MLWRDFRDTKQQVYSNKIAKLRNPMSFLKKQMPSKTLANISLQLKV